MIKVFLDRIALISALIGSTRSTPVVLKIRAGNPKWPIAASPREMLEIMLMQG